MILIAFEISMFPLSKQYPSESCDWRKDETDSSEFLPIWFDTLLPSFQGKEKTKKEEPKYTFTLSKFNRLI